MSHPPLCFVHGLACAPEDWDGVIATLDQLQARTAVDLGFFDPLAVEAPAPTIASLARRVLVAHQLLNGPAVLVGHSLGCRVVLEAARRQPDSVAGLVLIDGSRLTAGTPASWRAMVEADPVAFAEDFFGQMMGPKMPEETAGRLIARAKTMPSDKMARLLEDGAEWDHGGCDRALTALKTVPLMVLQSTVIGEDRRRRWLAEGEGTPWTEYVTARVPEARIEVLAGLGHFPMIEDPEAVSRLLSDFLAGLS